MANSFELVRKKKADVEWLTRWVSAAISQRRVSL